MRSLQQRKLAIIERISCKSRAYVWNIPEEYDMGDRNDGAEDERGNGMRGKEEWKG